MAGRRWIRGLAMMAMVASVCVAATARAAVDEETPRRFHFALDGHAGGVVGLAD